MEDIRDMQRSDWHRILEREYTVSPCSFGESKVPGYVLRPGTAG